MKIINIYIITINIISFIIYGIDKQKAIKQKWRINENILIILALIGGGAGSFIGMYTFHHKTKKIKFLILIPLITIIEYYIYKTII